ncbi:hypothetical protein AKJ16_DCAP17984 [Drosera capensis]
MPFNGISQLLLVSATVDSASASSLQSTDVPAFHFTNTRLLISSKSFALTASAKSLKVFIMMNNGMAPLCSFS